MASMSALLKYASEVSLCHTFKYTIPYHIFQILQLAGHTIHAFTTSLYQSAKQFCLYSLVFTSSYFHFIPNHSYFVLTVSFELVNKPV